MDSENSFVVPPCRVEIIPLPLGEVEMHRSMAVFRRDIEIRCSYSDTHRVILPRRATVPAVYIMHIPDGYELRHIPPRAPARYTPSPTIPLGLSYGSYPTRTHGIAPCWRIPSASASFEMTRRVQVCHCTRCHSLRESHMGSPTIAVRENPEFTPGSTSYGVRGRIQNDGDDVRGSVRRARLSPPPSSLWAEVMMFYTSLMMKRIQRKTLRRIVLRDSSMRMMG
ncbi:unnamed protein product [Lupinus luteus]|uniref:Uncharacterized protein n=1 Tax=Lupinus luteus TaxID=3873 RepID=A0AAV1WTV9_LUPLU